MMSHEELLRKLGLGGDSGADAIEGAFNDLLKRYQREVEDADNKFERVAAKRSLKEVEALRAEVERTVASERAELQLQRFQERLAENRVGAAKVALKEAERLVESAGLVEGFRLRLEEARADLGELEPVEEAPVDKVETVDSVDGVDSVEVEPETPGTAPETSPEAKEPEPLEPESEAVELKVADRLTLVHRETGDRIHVLTLPAVVFGRSRDCDVMVRVRHPDGGKEEDLANRRISRKHFRIEAVNGMVLLQDGSLSEKGRSPSTGGTCLEGQRIQSEILQPGRGDALQLTTQAAAESVPHWRIEYFTASQVLAEAAGSNAQRLVALRLHRLDLIKEDVLLILEAWKGSLSESEPEIFLKRRDGGFEYTGPNGQAIDWLEMIERLPEGKWRLSTAGLNAFEYAQDKGES
ncbi:MAG: FHA domain-containing protein [Opitutales bacterium]|nr:FHA domain-containing protein [Opitutales bacterium]